MSKNDQKQPPTAKKRSRPKNTDNPLFYLSSDVVEELREIRQLLTEIKQELQK